MITYYCRDCGVKLSEKEKVCPICGSKKRKAILQVGENLGIHDQVKGKGKEVGIKKSNIEFKIGDDFHRDSEKWNHREMYLDRKNDKYEEIVKNKDTGEIIHECKESLSQHVGHGSAKCMKYKPEYLKTAHKRSSFHKKEILESDICGCFYCKKTFLPTEINDWCDENNPKGLTALCPKCGIDSVIGSKSGYPVDDKEFLEEMKKYWF
jgi:uncharacterized Zn finger protein (UPF0148 family)